MFCDIVSLCDNLKVLSLLVATKCKMWWATNMAGSCTSDESSNRLDGSVLMNGRFSFSSSCSALRQADRSWKEFGAIKPYSRWTCTWHMLAADRAVTHALQAFCSTFHSTAIFGQAANDSSSACCDDLWAVSRFKAIPPHGAIVLLKNIMSIHSCSEGSEVLFVVCISCLRTALGRG